MVHENPSSSCTWTCSTSCNVPESFGSCVAMFAPSGHRQDHAWQAYHHGSSKQAVLANMHTFGDLLCRNKRFETEGIGCNPLLSPRPPLTPRSRCTSSCPRSRTCEPWCCLEVALRAGVDSARIERCRKLVMTAMHVEPARRTHFPLSPPSRTAY